jgi:16S rRNA (cytidine1402-2'-O)-methyltransferase
MKQPGTLYVVATPIGNLEDVTLRALRVLREVDLIACEDTRQTRKLLARHGIATPLAPYHEHNERRQTMTLVGRLQEGADIALVADAGVPGVSDPGYPLVTAAIEKGIRVVPVPGPSAVTAALSVSGLPTDKFLFLGFLPRTPAARRRALEEVRGVRATLVLCEAPHRIRKTVEDLAQVLGPRRAVLVRELTKIHEEVLHGSLHELAVRLRENPARGEMTVLVEGSAAEAPEAGAGAESLTMPAQAFVQDLIDKGASRRDAARQLAERYRLPRREAYRMVLRLKP